ncbi:hypothetical protein PIB30_031769 [Stylosanthes scabra]|uniref:Uncharacterized protein n=1 Tax=Stylosanthes scabra TaxID=79078 RepID=A0ABU6WAB8_9FABA|nr:hypothetical protein [Stylosanthes scabra]
MGNNMNPNFLLTMNKTMVLIVHGSGNIESECELRGRRHLVRQRQQSLEEPLVATAVSGTVGGLDSLRLMT